MSVAHPETAAEWRERAAQIAWRLDVTRSRAHQMQRDMNHALREARRLEADQ